MTTESDARLKMLSQPMGGPRAIPSITDPGRTKPVPRTLKQAFPISEGYRQSIEHYPAPTRLADRVSWGIVFALVGWLLWWVYHAPKGAA
jgi:hypothetical protein